jgi:hypothetical protein
MNEKLFTKLGVIKEKPLMDILNRKVDLRKELIELKKLHKNPEKQMELIEDIKIIDEFLSSHKIQK